ncbi:MAG: hypothetical protein WBG32_03290 [Nodosilinea sp.]
MKDFEGNVGEFVVAVGCLSVGEKVVKGFELGLSLYYSDRLLPNGPMLPSCHMDNARLQIASQGGAICFATQRER